MLDSSSFYKYSPVDQDDDFTKEYSIVNLLNSEVTFSSRNNFNDLFDSKIDLIPTDRNQLKDVAARLTASKRAEFKRLYIGDDWRYRVEKFISEINNLLDQYLYYCVSSNEQSNLMWSHYASSHKGFCIEWDSSKIGAREIVYRKDIAELKIISLIECHWELLSWDVLEANVIDAFSIKLKEWKYESEYRFQLSHEMKKLISRSEEKYTLVKFQPEWIKSIIWGCRTSDKTKSYIQSNLPYPVKFKQAYPGRNSIEISDVI